MQICQIQISSFRQDWKLKIQLQNLLYFKNLLVGAS